MLRWQSLQPLMFLIIATVLESGGDAVVRKALHAPTGATRLGLFLGGAMLLLSYGTFLNLAPLDFGRVIGLYLATLFVIWQGISFVFFHTLPSLPTYVGGSLVVAGGLIVTYWRPG